MSSGFNCFVQINGNTYEISTDVPTERASFEYIYPKVLEVVGIAENEFIDLTTHDFEILREGSRNGLKLESMTQTVKHLSIIYIIPKRIQSDGNQIPIASDSSQKTSASEFYISAWSTNQEILKEEGDIRLYHSIIMAINVDWNLDGNCSNWKTIQNRINKNVENPMSSHYLYNCFCKWTEYYAKNYDKLNGKLGPKSQHIFNLLKVIHTLDLNKSNNCPYRSYLLSIEKSQEHKQYYHKYLKPIRDEKKLKSTEDEVQNTYSTKIINRQNKEKLTENRNNISNYRAKHQEHLKELTLKREKLVNSSKITEDLIHNEIEVKDFYSIVMTIDGIRDFKGSEDNWSEVYKKVKLIDNSFIWKTGGNVGQHFNKLTEYYAQNYDYIEGKLSRRAQQVFDLLKVVHILDLSRFYRSSNETFLKIQEISKREDFKQYFPKIMSKIKEYMKENQISEKHYSKVYSMDSRVRYPIEKYSESTSKRTNLLPPQPIQLDPSLFARPPIHRPPREARISF